MTFIEFHQKYFTVVPKGSKMKFHDGLSWLKVYVVYTTFVLKYITVKYLAIFMKRQNLLVFQLEIITKKSELGVISVKLPSNSIFFYFVVHMYSEPTGGLSPCRAYLRGIYIFVCVFISYLNYTFTLSLSLVLRIMLAARILVFDIQ